VEGGWAEAWLGRAATYVAPTGWAYGLEGELQYAEKLGSHLMRLLVQGDGRVVGDALVAAKQDYYADVGEASAFHVATLAGTVLYGLPMARLQVTTTPRELAPVEDAPAWGSEGSAVADAVTGRTVLSTEEMAPGLWRVRSRQRIEGLVQREQAGASYWTLPSLQPWLEAGRAAQPMLRVGLPELSVGTQSLPVRTVVFVGGTYRDERVGRPWVVRASATGGAAAGGTVQPASGWQPAVPVALRAWEPTEGAGELLVGRREGRLLYAAGQYDAASGTQRFFEEIEVDEYYSASAERLPPVLQALRPTATDGQLFLPSEIGVEGVRSPHGNR
jgi:hypothetical protein